MQVFVHDQSVDQLISCHLVFQKSVEQVLQSTSQELATVRAELKSETAAHQSTRTQLASAHTEIVSSPPVCLCYMVTKKI
jgi:hypothetical protein